MTDDISVSLSTTRTAGDADMRWTVELKVDEEGKLNVHLEAGSNYVVLPLEEWTFMSDAISRMKNSIASIEQKRVPDEISIVENNFNVLSGEQRFVAASF